MTTQTFVKQTGKALGIVVLMLMACSSFAQSSKTKNSLLWKIEGNGLTKPSYLFGTVHMICKDNFVMPEKVSKAISQTTQSYLEIDMDAPDMVEQSKKHMQSAQTTSSQITPQEAVFVDSILKKKLGAGLKALDNVKPMMLIASIMSTGFTCQLASFESEIIKATAAGSKQTYGLSTIEEQYSFMEKIFDTKDFPKYLKEMEGFQFSEVFTNMYKFYKEENIEGVNNLLKDFSSSNPEAYHQLLTVRNNLWVDRLPAIIRDQPTFIGVGCAHLSGETGMLTLLRKKGYTVTPVYE